MEPKKSIAEVYQLFFQNLFNFNGRTRRSEFWPVILINACVSGVISGIFSYIPNLVAATGSSGGTVVATIFSGIGSLISIAIAVMELGLIIRRLHDVGKEWTYIFMGLIPIAGPIILLINYLKDSEPGDNKFGPNPKGVFANPNGFNQGFDPQQQAYNNQPQQDYYAQQQAPIAPPQPAYTPQPQQAPPVEQQPVYAPQPQAYEVPQPQQVPVESPQPQAFDAPQAPAEPTQPQAAPQAPVAPVQPQAPATTCPSCGVSVAPGINVCPACGTVINQ